MPDNASDPDDRPGAESGRGRAPVPDRGGRPAATSPHELAAAAQALFLARGFEQTSVDDITAAVGVSRRTFFRYFPTKADVLWVESDVEIGRLQDALRAAAQDVPWRDALTSAVVDALHHDDSEREWALHRAQLILTVPAAQAQAQIRFTAWREAGAAFVARRTGRPADDVLPIAAGHAVLAATLAAHEYWVAHPATEIGDALASFLPLLLPRGPDVP